MSCRDYPETACLHQIECWPSNDYGGLMAFVKARWWHEWVMRAQEIRFLKGRLHFTLEGTSGPAPFPSCVVVFRPL